MKNDFVRYKIERLRVLTGVLELIGGAGLLIGLYFAHILVISSLGLFLIMSTACFFRFKFKDSIISSLPAIFFALLNLYIFIEALQKLACCLDA